MPKVILDAGHGGSDVGEYYERRSEKNDNLLLALRVGQFLTERGIEVEYTRTADVYLPMMNRVNIVNQEDADLLVSLHRLSGNAYHSTPSLDFFIKENDEIGLNAANNIGQSLKGSGYERYGNIVRTDIPILSETDIPAIMVGIGYIRSKNDNLNYDNNFVEIAEGIADGIYKTLMSTESGVSISDYIGNQYGYRVVLGPFRDYNEAIYHQLILYGLGYVGELHKSRNYYIHIIGFSDLDDAARTELDLRRYGFRSFVIKD